MSAARLSAAQRAYRDRILSRASVAEKQVYGSKLPFEEFVREPSLDRFQSSHICDVFQEVKRKFWEVIPSDFAWHLQVDDMARFTVRYRWKKAREGSLMETVQDSDYAIVLGLLKHVDWPKERKERFAAAPVAEPQLSEFERVRAEIRKRREGQR